MIVARSVEYSCPWLDVVAKQVLLPPPRGEETFYSVRTGEYCAVLALTDDGRVPLVSQFRPAVEDDVLELPSGAVEPGEDPGEAMRRELLEETGCAAEEMILLGALHTDSGRMETRQWGFFAPGVQVGAAVPDTDEQLELRFVERGDLRGLVARGELRMAPHLAVLCLAVAAGHLEL